MRWLDESLDSMDLSLVDLGVGDRQGGLAVLLFMGLQSWDTTERLN